MLEELIGPKRPVTWSLQFWPVFVASFLCALAATWLCKKLASRLGIVDRPDAKVKTHREPVAYLGGVGMFAGLVVGVLAGVYLMQGTEHFACVLRWLLGILAGGAIACFIGLVDDIVELKPRQKFIGQIVAAGALIVVGIRPVLHHFTDTLGWQMPWSIEYILGVPVVIFFVLGATNSLNLIDGLDGLCAGITLIITFAYFLLAVHLSTWGFSAVGDPVRIIVCLALVGGAAGFLPFNRYPAKIFMGDAGSMLLGFNVAALMILFAESIPRWWMASIVIFGLPILDTATALVRRWLNKKPLFVSDRGHLYDQFMDRGHSQERTVNIFYNLARVYALIGLVMSQIRTRYALIVYILVVMVSGLMVWRKGYLKMEGIRGTIKQ